MRHASPEERQRRIVRRQAAQDLAPQLLPLQKLPDSSVAAQLQPSAQVAAATELGPAKGESGCEVGGKQGLPRASCQRRRPFCQENIFFQPSCKLKESCCCQKRRGCCKQGP